MTAGYSSGESGVEDESLDENLWLEDIFGTEALTWAEDRSAETIAAFSSPAFDLLADRLLEVIDSDERIPFVSKRGEFYYNFWRDAEHPRGVWRRTTLDFYLNDDPPWQVLLDVDELGREEGTEWVFSGARLLPNDYSRALVSLSPDGGDATTIREFDLDALAFVADGFTIPTAKGFASWIDRDTIYVGTDFGPGSMTSSSYPRTVRRMSRGDSLDQATIVHEVGVDDLEAMARRDHTPGFERDFIIEYLDFYRSRTFVVVDGEPVLIEVPEDADVQVHREWLLVQPRSDWFVGGRAWMTGTLLVISLDDFLAGSRAFEALFTPDARTALESWSWTRTRLVLTLLHDVSSQLVALVPSEGWAREDVPGIPSFGTARVVATDPDESDELWIQVTGFLTPPALLRGVLGADGSPLSVVKKAPSFFDASPFEVSQHWATSRDGTSVPYFQVAPAGLVLDASHPTLMSGYGGFQVSRLPEYSGVTGRGWLERGGVFVLANIRGGGEFGPAWHTAALRENRPRAYEDFAAIALDLIRRGVTSASRLGCEGRSNGGLLVGNMLVSYPELFGAIVCGVPLLDMLRYTKLSAGASWIAEYGDPDVPADREFLRGISPYHLLRQGVSYPSTLLYAATSDDRVGPVQARKLAARMLAAGVPDTYYYENSDGGHGGAVDNAHSARLQALIYEFLWRRLS